MSIHVFSFHLPDFGLFSILFNMKNHDWFLKSLYTLAAIGLLALLAGIVAGTVWVFNHIKFVT